MTQRGINLLLSLTRSAGCAFAFAFASSAAHATYPGQLDTTFGCAAPATCAGYRTTGVPAPSGAASGYSLALQSDGKIVMAGASGSGSTSGFGVARFNADGTLDTTFNSTGTNTTQFGTGDDHANAAAIQSDGKIVAAGSAFGSFGSSFAL